MSIIEGLSGEYGRFDTLIELEEACRERFAQAKVSVERQEEKLVLVIEPRDGASFVLPIIHLEGSRIYMVRYPEL